jgi:hypothetical protein
LTLLAHAFATSAVAASADAPAPEQLQMKPTLIAAPWGVLAEVPVAAAVADPDADADDVFFELEPHAASVNAPAMSAITPNARILNMSVSLST